MNFDETELKRKKYHTSINKVKLIRENIVVIEAESFYGMHLTDDATFLLALTKLSK